MSSGENGGSPAGERYLDSAGRDWGYDTLLSVNLVTCSLVSVKGAVRDAVFPMGKNADSFLACIVRFCRVFWVLWS